MYITQRCPQWSDDELVCARNVTNEVHFFEGGEPSKIIWHICGFDLS